MKASSFARRVRAGLVAGCAIATVIAAAPAHSAQVPPPVIQSTSLTANNTWSKIDNTIAVDYNRAIDTALSTVVVTDGAGNPVQGMVDTPHIRAIVNQANGCERFAVDITILMFFLPNAPGPVETDPCPLHPTGFPKLTEEDGPYTVTFTAYSVNQITGTLPTVSSYTFRLDKTTPHTPSLTAIGTPLPRDAFPKCVLGNDTTGFACTAWPSSPVPRELAVIAPGDLIRLSGVARDRTDAQGNPDLTSGIAKATLHFFSATSGDMSGREVMALRTDIMNSCTGGLCPVDQSFTAQPDLPPGYWNIRASTTDLAGNVSGQSDPVAVLVTN